MDKSIWLLIIAIILVSFISTIVFLYWFLKRRKKLQEETSTKETILIQPTKRNSRNIIIIFLIIFIFVFEIVGICLVYSAHLRKKVCNTMTDGVVIELGEGSKNNKKMYYPIVEYQVGNKVIRGISNVRTNSRPFKIGTHVTIGYNPSNPDEFYIAGYDLNVIYKLGAIFMFTGIANALIFIILIILNKAKINDEKKQRIEGKIFVVYVVTLICTIWILIAGLAMTLCVFTIFGLFSLYIKYKAKNNS